MKKIVILYSGGLDSFIMYQYALTKYPRENIQLVHYDIGQAYNFKEAEAIQKAGVDCDIRTVDWLAKGEALLTKPGSICDIYIPGRNMTLASLAASAYMPDEVWMGGLKGEDHAAATDKNGGFIAKVNALWEYTYAPFDTVPRLVFPLIDNMWGKFEAVEWLSKQPGITTEQILSTSSCLSGEKDGNCGLCMVCCRRYYIFKQLGFSEEYDHHPLSSHDNVKMIIRMLKGEYYDQWRRREILPGLYQELGTDDHEVLIAKMKAML